MRYLEVCAGISASSVAWNSLGWKAAAYSEIDPAAIAVLTHHYAETPLHGDFTTIRGDEYGPIDLLIGGTPCQDFSIAGLRAGLDGDRGNLSLEFLRLADRARPRWLAWENVPGVLSINEGRAFGAILGGMAQLGYGWAYRILDAQFFGVPQQRRRVFIVAYLGDWRRAGAVLLEREGFAGHPPPPRPDISKPARTLTRGAKSSGRGGYAGRRQEDDYNIIAHTDGRLRHFTPLEKERLMGFPDGYTAVPFGRGLMADSPRSQVLGNSIPVPFMSWIGRRIGFVDQIR